jgi:hypothetical protein
MLPPAFAIHLAAPSFASCGGYIEEVSRQRKNREKDSNSNILILPLSLHLTPHPFLFFLPHHFTSPIQRAIQYRWGEFKKRLGMKYRPEGARTSLGEQWWMKPLHSWTPLNQLPLTTLLYPTAPHTSPDYTASMLLLNQPDEKQVLKSKIMQVGNSRRRTEVEEEEESCQHEGEGGEGGGEGGGGASLFDVLIPFCNRLETFLRNLHKKSLKSQSYKANWNNQNTEESC